MKNIAHCTDSAHMGHLSMREMILQGTNLAKTTPGNTAMMSSVAGCDGQLPLLGVVPYAAKRPLSLGARNQAALVPWPVKKAVELHFFLFGGF